MAGPEGIEWRRGPRTRAWGRLSWYGLLGGIVVIIAFVLFGSEPSQLDSGRSNPLALMPTGVTVLWVAVATPFVVALFRRPLVAADHYALSVRPGILRTLMLPWARIVEIAAYGVRDEAFLLIRCRNGQDRLGDLPRWWDKLVLRAATRGRWPRRGGGPVVSAYDVAVRMDEFVGDPASQLAALAAFAPHHVVIADELS
jgi:hypothetical protein